MEGITISIDTMWILFATVLVFLMQAGFSLVETGLTRAKNAGNIIMKNYMDLSIGSLFFWLIGFSIMFGLDKFGCIGQHHDGCGGRLKRTSARRTRGKDVAGFPALK